MAAEAFKPSPIYGELREQHSPELRAFLADYFKGDSIRLRPPCDNVLVDQRGVTSIVLFREGQFQVELVVVGPHVEIPSHCHDDVESYEVGVSGQMALFVEGVQVAFMREPRASGMMRDFGRYVPVPSDAPHGGRSGPRGATFLSVQRWRDGVAPTHVGLNWREA